MQSTAVLEHFEQRHKEGDRLAALDCAVYCKQQVLEWPTWARSAIVRAYAEYRSNLLIDLDDAFFGRGRGKGGRHADPRVEHKDRAQHEAVVAAFRGAEMAGFKKSARRQQATSVLNALKIRPPAPETMDKIYRAACRLDYEPERLQAPVATVTKAGEVTYPTEYGTLHTSTQNAVACSGTLHALFDLQRRR